MENKSPKIVKKFPTNESNAAVRGTPCIAAHLAILKIHGQTNMVMTPVVTVGTITRQIVRCPETFMTFMYLFDARMYPPTRSDLLIGPLRLGPSTLIIWSASASSIMAWTVTGLKMVLLLLLLLLPPARPPSHRVQPLCRMVFRPRAATPKNSAPTLGRDGKNVWKVRDPSCHAACCLAKEVAPRLLLPQNTRLCLCVESRDSD
mmetsp:Transcript_105493/g.303291  ORF Transcript_105493/g.303291 Transcript_105493/m.303291 type:complete len:204 (+) Transcript_105493:761-1372(+)